LGWRYEKAGREKKQSIKRKEKNKLKLEVKINNLQRG
jgi:hypothetical protein